MGEPADSHVANADADEEACRRGCGHPPGRDVQGAPSIRTAWPMKREADDSRRVPEMFDASRNLRLLRQQGFLRKPLVDFLVGLGANAFGKCRDIGVPRLAGRAVREVIGGQRIEHVAGSLGDIAFIQPVVGKMTRAQMLREQLLRTDHGLPPRMLRSLRAALNK